jgi:precorrin-6A/cobalt-precorrin-6A reductase
MRKTILILGGTAEAVELAHRTAALPKIRTISSLAGRTRSPVRPPGELRIGGFGGADALARFLVVHRVAALVDATHPFAVSISANAAAACDKVGCPRLVLHRPPWLPGKSDHWLPVPDPSAAATMLVPGARVLLTTGHRDLETFAARTDVTFVIRLVEPPSAHIPNATLILARGPFALEDERSLLDAHGITVLVTRNSGGTAGQAKLDAAREAAIDVVMIERPPPPPGDRVGDAASAIDWLEAVTSRAG